MKLRMAFFTAPILVRPEFIPFPVGHETLVREGRKDHRAMVEPGQSCEQRRDCGRRSRNTRTNGEAFGWLALPALRQRTQEPAAPVGQVDDPTVGKQRWPAFEHSLEAPDRLEPVAGQFRCICRRFRQAR